MFLNYIILIKFPKEFEKKYLINIIIIVKKLLYGITKIGIY